MSKILFLLLSLLNSTLLDAAEISEIFVLCGINGVIGIKINDRENLTIAQLYEKTSDIYPKTEDTCKNLLITLNDIILSLDDHGNEKISELYPFYSLFLKKIDSLRKEGFHGYHFDAKYLNRNILPQNINFEIHHIINQFSLDKNNNIVVDRLTNLNQLYDEIRKILKKSMIKIWFYVVIPENDGLNFSAVDITLEDDKKKKVVNFIPQKNHIICARQWSRARIIEKLKAEGIARVNDILESEFPDLTKEFLSKLKITDDDLKS